MGSVRTAVTRRAQGSEEKWEKGREVDRYSTVQSQNTTDTTPGQREQWGGWLAIPNRVDKVHTTGAVGWWWSARAACSAGRRKVALRRLPSHYLDALISLYSMRVCRPRVLGRDWSVVISLDARYTTNKRRASHSSRHLHHMCMEQHGAGLWWCTRH